MTEAPSYGRTRKTRADLTYLEIERAATAILKTGKRPTLESLRLALGGGSARTLLEGLNRYWGDLGNQIAGSPDSVRRLPAAVADLAEGLWHKALASAADAMFAKGSANEKQVIDLKSQLELREHTLTQREIELDEQLRTHERTIKELHDNLRAALSMLSKRDATIQANERKAAFRQREIDDCRRRLTHLTSTNPSPRRRQKRTPRKVLVRSKPNSRVPSRKGATKISRRK